MTVQLFGIKNSEDNLKALIAQYEDFLKDDMSTIKAVALSSTAWHLTEWVFNEYHYTGDRSDTSNTAKRKKENELGIFRNTLIPRCPSLKIMHDLANAHKHSEVSRPKASIKQYREHAGEFSREFSNEYNVSCLRIELEDGTFLYFTEEIREVVDFWKDYFKNDLGKS